MKVVRSFLKAGVPFNKIDCFKDILEENGYRLTDQKNLFDLIHFIQQQEQTQLQEAIKNKKKFCNIWWYQSAWWSSCYCGEIYYWWLGDKTKIGSVANACKEFVWWVGNQYLLCLSLMVFVLINYLRDRCTVNNVAIKTLKLFTFSLLMLVVFHVQSIMLVNI